jgi:hypothetical protein
MEMAHRTGSAAYHSSIQSDADPEDVCSYERIYPPYWHRVERRLDAEESRTIMHHRVWQELYQAAIAETDDKMMPNRLQLAKAAIDSRLHVLQLDHGGTPEERRAISDALHALNVLKQELEKHGEKRAS